MAEHELQLVPTKDTKPTDHSFPEKYKALCKLYETSKSPYIKVEEKRLHILGDSIPLKDWKPILEALGEDRCLHCVIVKGRLALQKFDYEAETEVDTRQVKHPFLTSYIIKSLFSSLKKCLSNSRCLTYLTLQKIPLKGDLLTTLCEVMKSSNTLQHLAIQITDMGNEGCEKLCRTLYDKSNLVTLDLSDCQIGSVGALHIAQLLNHQELTRNLESWKHNLRDRVTDDDCFPGLRRVTLNHNSILDSGLADLIHVLLDDKWIKAIDMQDCGITDSGAELVIKLLEENPLIVVFDIRKNDIHPELLFNVFQLLDGRATETDNKNFGWIEKSTLEQVMGGKKLRQEFERYTSPIFPKYKNPKKNLQTKHTVDEPIVNNSSVDKDDAYLTECSEISDVEEELSPNSEALDVEDGQSKNKSVVQKQDVEQPCNSEKSSENVNTNVTKIALHRGVRKAKSAPGLTQKNSKQDVSGSTRTQHNPRGKFTLSSVLSRPPRPRGLPCGDGIYNRYESVPRKRCGPPKHESPPPRNGFIPLYSQEGNQLTHRKPINLNAMLPEKPPPLVKTRGKSTTYSQSYRNVTELAKIEQSKSRMFRNILSKNSAQKKPVPSSKPKPFL